MSAAGSMLGEGLASDICVAIVSQRSRVNPERRDKVGRMGRNGRAVVAGLVVGVFVAVGALAPDLSLLWSIVTGAVVGVLVGLGVKWWEARHGRGS